MNPKAFILKLILSAFILLLGHLFLGFNFEDNENIVKAILYGEFGKVGSDLYFNDYHLFLVPLFYKVSTAFPSVPIYGIWYTILTYIWLSAYILYFTRNQQSLNLKSIASIFIISGLIVTLTLKHIVFFHCITITILLGAIGILFSRYGHDHNKKTWYWFGVFFFFVALVTRMHTPVVILTLFIGIHIFLSKEIIGPLKKYLPHIMLSILFISTYQIFGLITNNPGRLIEANYEYTILEKKSLLPQNESVSSKDSIKYEALMAFYITDSSEFTIDYFESMVNIAPGINKTMSFENLKFAIEELIDKTRYSFWTILFISFLLLPILLISGNKQKNFLKLTVISFLCFSIPFGLLVFLVDDMKLRFFTPYIAVCCFILIDIFADFSKLKGIGQLLLLAITTVFFIEVYSSTKQMSQKEDQLNKERIYAAKKLQAYSQKHPIICTMGADIPLVSAAFYKSEELQYKNIAYFDGGYLTYYSYLINRFNELFQTNPLDYKSLIKLLKNNKDIRFYSVENRMDLIREYFKIVYSYEFDYKEIDKQPDLGYLNGKIYYLK